jgi:biopolymer transport protein ExbD
MLIKKKARVALTADAEVDITPMTDCSFLLLIFFMVTTVFIEVRGLQVDLPAPGEQQQEEQQKKKDVNIQVTANGDYIVSGSPVPAEALSNAIKGAMDEFNNRNVIIQGDPASTHRSIVFAMDKAYEVGAEGMAFAIEQEESGPEAQ